MKTNIIAAAALSLGLVNPAIAQTADFSDAMNLWLSGDDAASLPALAQDARGGDVRAQVILGQVDRDTIPGGYSDYLRGLSRADRAQLLRAPTPDGETINWLLTMAGTEHAAVADAVFNYDVNLDPIDAALDLQFASEKSLAAWVLWRTLNNGKFNLVQTLPADDGGLGQAGFMTWISAYFADQDRSLSLSRFLADARPNKIEGLLALKRLERVLNLGGNFSAGLNEMVTVLQGRGNQLAPTADVVTLDANLSLLGQVDPRVAVVDRMCAARPAIVGDYHCRIQTFEIIGGYTTLLAVRTPAELAIPADVYLASDRAVTALADLVRGLAPKDMARVRSANLQALITGE